MEHTSIRITSNLLGDLKILKGYLESSSYQEVIHGLVHEKLMESHAYTKNGYLEAGTVVCLDLAGAKPLVIDSITLDKVYFTDKSYLINGGKSCFGMEVLADSVENYGGGRIHE